METSGSSSVFALLTRTAARDGDDCHHHWSWGNAMQLEVSESDEVSSGLNACLSNA